MLQSFFKILTLKPIPSMMIHVHCASFKIIKCLQNNFYIFPILNLFSSNLLPITPAISGDK